jgi:mannose-1-phosphate guanylyltransferase
MRILEELMFNKNNGKTRALLLAAGMGTRLAPLTDIWPKCLMPVCGRPLLEYWLHALGELGVESVLINLHYRAGDVCSFLQQEEYRDWVGVDYEEELLGTGGTLLKNKKKFEDCTTLLIHADNLCVCDMRAFVDFHMHKRPPHTLMTLMTFETSNPQSCGIVELDEDGVVVGFHEKSANPPGNLASAAVFLLEPQVFDWLEMNNNKVFDLSRDALPLLLGKMATWHNVGLMQDIGNIEDLRAVQKSPQVPFLPPKENAWFREFCQHPIHSLLENA